MSVSSGRARSGLIQSLTCAALLATGASAARAQDAAEAASAPGAGRIAIELNGAEANGPACRLSFVVANGLAQSIDDMALELVLFDRDGRVDRFVIVRTAKIPAGKSRVRRFDMPETACPSIARILVNDVKECAGAGLDPSGCADSIDVTTRTDIRFEN
ncbi:hypothetical protein [Kaistia adipata]|uniref:hypothetical protein n=1 Tax=Kaistia adipata TaxID=166954 RepID=UPI0004147371|nr:hypothetical protein [Kaistia adipata]